VHCLCCSTEVSTHYCRNVLAPKCLGLNCPYTLALVRKCLLDILALSLYRCVLDSKCLITGQAIGEIWWFFIFPSWWPSTILDLSCTCLDHLQRAFARVGGVYYCLKFGWNRCGSFDNMQVLIFLRLRVENAYSCP